MNIVYMSYRLQKYYMNIFICLQQQFQKIKHHNFSVLQVLCFNIWLFCNIKNIRGAAGEQTMAIICNGEVSDWTQQKQGL